MQINLESDKWQSFKQLVLASGANGLYKDHGSNYTMTTINQLTTYGIAVKKGTPEETDFIQTFVDTNIFMEIE